MFLSLLCAYAYWYLKEIRVNSFIENKIAFLHGGWRAVILNTVCYNMRFEIVWWCIGMLCCLRLIWCKIHYCWLVFWWYSHVNKIIYQVKVLVMHILNNLSAWLCLLMTLCLHMLSIWSNVFIFTTFLIHWTMNFLFFYFFCWLIGEPHITKHSPFFFLIVLSGHPGV